VVQAGRATRLKFIEFRPSFYRIVSVCAGLFAADATESMKKSGQDLVRHRSRD
jgi:hypothetical protein